MLKFVGMAVHPSSFTLLAAVESESSVLSVPRWLDDMTSRFNLADSSLLSLVDKQSFFSHVSLVCFAFFLFFF